MLFPILKKQETYDQMVRKLAEEVNELAQAENEYSAWGGRVKRDNLVEETMDCIQVCIGILEQLQKEGVLLTEAGFKHMLKLSNRHKFKFEGYVSMRRVE